MSQALESRAASAGDHEVAAWRARTLDGLLRVLVAIGLPAAVAGIAMSLATGVYLLAVFDAAAWAGLLWLHRRVEAYFVRASMVLGMFFAVGLVVTVLVGPLGVGYLWFAGVPPLAGVFFGRRTLYAAVASVVVALLGLGGVLELVRPLPNGLGYLWWVMASTSVACVSLITGLPVVEIIDGMRRSVSERDLARSAAREAESREAALHAEFEALFLTTPLALLLIDERGAVVRANVAAEALFGELREPAALAERLSAGTLSQVIDAAAGAAGGGSAHPLRAARATSATGTPIELEGAIVPIARDGKGYALLGAADVSERLRAQAELTRALRDNVVLLQEVHHRVKNNLQIVSSLLSLEADRSTDEALRATLADSTRRVRTMALIHQQLYSGSDFACIDLHEYVRTLVGELHAMAGRAELTLELEPVRAELGQALPCGLVLNELVTNAFKHGRSGDGVCRVRVSLRPEGPEGFALEVTDEGRGLSAPWRELRRRSLGAQIVDALARQLRGSLEVSSPGAGARFVLRCSAQASEPSSERRSAA